MVGWTKEEGSKQAEISTEFAEHGSLDKVLKQVGLDAAPSFLNATGTGILICGLVLGMRYVHWKGYIHMDLKPSNILLNARGEALIGDFGSSRLESEEPIVADSGSVYYAAPEQFEENTVLTRKADVFSFGLILYELLTHSAVFPPSMSPFAVLRKRRTEDLPAVPDACGEFMIRLISACWSPDPTRRPSFDDILTEFVRVKFDIVLGANPSELESYVHEIRRRESSHQH
jgi:serine/threonine protein kinase